MIGTLTRWLFGGPNTATNLIEVFKENSEASAVRDAHLRQATLAQFQQEFRASPPSRFNSFMDGVNRIPRPTLALGTIALFACAMFEPKWFTERMQGLAYVPEPMWWLMGVVVSFYFGARHQAKEQQQLREMINRFQMQTVASAKLRDIEPSSKGQAIDIPATLGQTETHEPGILSNAAMQAWHRKKERLQATTTP